MLGKHCRSLNVNEFLHPLTHYCYVPQYLALFDTVFFRQVLTYFMPIHAGKNQVLSLLDPFMEFDPGRFGKLFARFMASGRIR